MTDEAQPPPEVSHAGAVVDQAITYLVEHQIGSLAIASALLGGALGLMARSMPTEAIIEVLQNAMDSARRGELQAMDRV
jgi:hypothetical protein